MKPFRITSVFTMLLFAGLSAICQNQEVEINDSLEYDLNEVLVTAIQPATKLVGTTLVSTISGSNLANLGTALDVLQQLPMIKVTDNTVSVIGKSNVEIYIDGRPMRDNDELIHLQSANLWKVELLLAPGAAYESTTGAVLKITTQRNFVRGLSVTDRFELQKRRKWSVMDYLDASYKTGNWELFVNGTVNHNNSLSKGSTTNSFIYDGRQTLVGSSQHNSYPTTTGVVKAGFNYSDGPQSFGAYYRFNPERGDFTNHGSEWMDSESPITRLIEKRIRSHSHLASVYYEDTFADRYMLHFDGDFRQSSARSGVETTYPQSTAAQVNSSDYRTSTLWAGKLYLNFPLMKGDFTAGTQNSYTHTALDFRMLTPEIGHYIPSSYTDAKQTSSALFASWSRMFGPLSLTAGVRYEYIDYVFTVDGRRSEDMSRRSHLLTPDLSLQFTFNEDARLALSYKAATVRPPYSQLTGSLNYVGRHEIEGGNPGLRDEKLHDLQLFGMWHGFMVQADFIKSHDSYAYVKQLYPARDLQLLMHPININVNALSLYLIWSKPIGCWTPDITAGLYAQRLTLDRINYRKPIFSWYFDNVFALPHGWTITANISGNTSGDMHTNRFSATPFKIDASIGKKLLDNNLNIKLSATDIFNTSNNNWTMNTYGIFVDKRQSYDQRGISLSLIYTFQPRKSRYKGSSAAESEMKRL